MLKAYDEVKVLPFIGSLKSIHNAPANGFHQRRLAGVAILARLNGLAKTPVSILGLAKYLPVSAILSLCRELCSSC